MLQNVARILLNVDWTFAELYRNSPIPGKILKMLKFCALVVKIGVDTADRLIRWCFFYTLALCKIKMKVQIFLLENLQPAVDFWTPAAPSATARTPPRLASAYVTAFPRRCSPHRPANWGVEQKVPRNAGITHDAFLMTKLHYSFVSIAGSICVVTP